MSHARPTPAHERREARLATERQRIVTAAYELVGRADQPTSVQDILTASGLSTRAFYRHFKSKDELILTMYRIASDRVTAELERVTTAADGPVAALRAWITQSLAVVYDSRRTRQTAVLSSSEARATAGFAQAHQQDAARRRTLLAAVIRRGIDDDVFPDATDPLEDARAIDSVVSGLIAARLAGADCPDWDEAAEHTAGLFLRAFGPRPTT